MLNKPCFCIVILTILVVFITLVLVGSLRSGDTETTSFESEVQQTDLEESTALIQFRNIIQSDELYASYMKEDSFLVDWIRDSNYELEKAAVKLRKSLAWRLKNKMDTILEEDYSDIQKYCPFTANGRDIYGNVVGMTPFGSCKLRKLGLMGKIKRFEKYVLREFERFAVLARDLRLKTGKHIELVGVVDFNGFSLLEQGCVKCIPIMPSLFTIYQDNYPGYMKSWYVINVSKMGQRFLDLMLVPLFSPKTREITKIYSDRSEWEPILLKTIPRDQLPLQFNTN